jgi:hypothetical protein
MTRTYCDACDVEIPRGQPDRLRREHYLSPGRVIDVEVITAWNKTWNGGHLCAGCILAAVADGKPVQS